MTEPYFRGFHAIGEVAKKADRIAANARFLPHIRVLRLYRRDYDLVARWPNAAKLHGFEFAQGVISFKGFQITFDGSAERYVNKTSALLEVDHTRPLTPLAAPHA